MIKHILYFEWKNIKRSKIVIWTAVILSLLIFLSIHTGNLAVKNQLDNIKKIKQEEKERHEKLLTDIEKVESGEKKVNAYTNPKTPYMVGGKYGSYEIFKEPGELSFISLGQSDFFPYHYRISIRNRQLYSFLAGDDKMENPINQQNSNFDLAFVLIWLLPLFVITFSYNILSSEKEFGTLKLLKASSISITKILLIKILLRFIIITSISIVSILLLFYLYGVNISDNMSGISKLFLFICSYTLFWFLISAIVNLFSKSSIVNAGILFAVWLLLILIVPAILNIVSNYKYPVATRIEYVNFIREATYEIDNNSDKVLDEYFLSHPELGIRKSKNMPFWVYKNALKNKIIKDVSGDFVNHRNSQFNKQVEFINNFKYLSPAIAMQQTLNKISGNSTSDFLKFQAKADECNDKWRMYFFPKILRDELMSKNDVLNLPEYH